jgi:hypothetical protein
MLAAAMPKLLEPPRLGRYTYEKAAFEVQRWCDEERGRRKRLAAALGIHPTSFSPRLRGIKAKFSIEQLGVIADEARAPDGWPFISWERAQAMADSLKKKR